MPYESPCAIICRGLGLVVARTWCCAVDDAMDVVSSDEPPKLLLNLLVWKGRSDSVDELVVLLMNHITRCRSLYGRPRT